MSVAADLIQLLQELADELAGGATSPGRDQALADLQTFENESQIGVWPNLAPYSVQRRFVAERARQLVKAPASISQGSLGLCGPAAFLRLWIARDPVAFVKLVAGLFNTGTGALGSMQVKPSEALRNQEYPAISNRLMVACPITDWMVMSSMRDSANLILDYLGTPDEEYAEGTSLGNIVTWMQATGLYSKVEKHSASHPVADALALKPGPNCDVILAVDAAILEKQNITGSLAAFIQGLSLGSASPDHVMILNTPTEKTGADTYALSVWTWASNRTLTVTGTTLAADYAAAVVAEV
jgi:hypothetical protein